MKLKLKKKEVELLVAMISNVPDGQELNDEALRVLEKLHEALAKKREEWTIYSRKKKG